MKFGLLVLIACLTLAGCHPSHHQPPAHRFKHERVQLVKCLPRAGERERYAYREPDSNVWLWYILLSNNNSVAVNNTYNFNRISGSSSGSPDGANGSYTLPAGGSWSRGPGPNPQEEEEEIDVEIEQEVGQIGPESVQEEIADEPVEAAETTENAVESAAPSEAAPSEGTATGDSAGGSTGDSSGGGGGDSSGGGGGCGGGCGAD